VFSKLNNGAPRLRAVTLHFGVQARANLGLSLPAGRQALTSLVESSVAHTIVFHLKGEGG